MIKLNKSSSEIIYGKKYEALLSMMSTQINLIKITDLPVPIKIKQNKILTMKSEAYWRLSKDKNYLIRLNKLLTPNGEEYREVESGKIFKVK